MTSVPQSTVAYSSFTAAYTIPLAKRLGAFPPSDTPSPQAYGFLDLNVAKKRAPEWRISESKKVSVFDVKNKHPSPGNYEVPSYTKAGGSCTIGFPIEPIEDHTKISPALYTPNYNFGKHENPAISLTLRAAPEIKKTFQETPGPGAYEQNFYEMSSPSQKIKTKGNLTILGVSQKSSLMNKDTLTFPAPNTYSINSQVTQAVSPSFKFQSGQRTELINPIYEKNGPAMYDVSQEIAKIPGSTPSSKVLHSHLHNSLISHTQPSANNKSTSESRMDTNPGPGSYIHDLSFFSNNSKSTKFGSAQRLKDISENNILPGPGHYQLTQGNRSQSFNTNNTFGNAKKASVFQNTIAPGPGQYNISPLMGKGPKYGIGGASISSFIPKSTNPGPGQYTINESQTKPSPFSVKFNSKIDSNLSFQLPGPGSYDPQYDTFRTSKMSFNSGTVRDVFGIKDEGPSPADYSIQPQIAGLPEYHYKQINYFKDHIKNMRQQLNPKSTLQSKNQRDSLKSFSSPSTSQTKIQQQE